MISLPDNLIPQSDAELSKTAAPRDAIESPAGPGGLETTEKDANEQDAAFDEIFAGIMLTIQTPSDQAGPEAVNSLPTDGVVEPTFSYTDQVIPETPTSTANPQLLVSTNELPATGNASATGNGIDTGFSGNADVAAELAVPQQVDGIASPEEVVVANRGSSLHLSDSSISFDKSTTQNLSKSPNPLVADSQVADQADIERQTPSEHKASQLSEFDAVLDKQSETIGPGDNDATVKRGPNPGAETTGSSIPRTVTNIQSEEENAPVARTIRNVRLHLSDHNAVENAEKVAITEQSREFHDTAADVVNHGVPIHDRLNDRSVEPGETLLSSPMSHQHESLSNEVAAHSFSINKGILIESISREIIDRARIKTGRDETRIELDLDPPELGRVLVRLSETSEGITARIVVAKEHVWHALGESLADFQSTLADAGIDLRGFSLSQQGHEASTGFTDQSLFRNNQARSNSSSKAASSRTRHIADYQARSDRVVDIRA